MFPWAHWVTQSNLENGRVLCHLFLADTVTQQLCNWNILYLMPFDFIVIVDVEEKCIK